MTASTTLEIPTIAVFPEENLTLDQKVEKWVWQLCRALEENYKGYHLRSMKLMNAESASEYTRKEIEATEHGTANLMRFRMEFGRKYIKIIQQDYDTFRDRNEYKDGGVHAFINRKTGEVYKPASWKSPAKHVRYDLRLIKDREYVLNPQNCGWAGGYLYMR